jgi:RimJ/RimL family protein N-acetyltransferase
MMVVRFRPVRVGDLRRLNELVNDREVARFLQVVPPVSLKSTRDFYGKCRRERVLWSAVVVDGVVAGSVNLRRKEAKKSRHAADIGIALAREYWGRGVGAAAMDYLIGRVREMGLKRVELAVEDGNRRAIRLYKSRGFAVEGRLRKAVKSSGRYHDTLLMARLL